MMLVVDKIEPVETLRKPHSVDDSRCLTSGMPLKWTHQQRGGIRQDEYSRNLSWDHAELR